MNILKEIKWFIQRGRRGWADCDTWSFDDYLSNIIIGGVRELAKRDLGCPSEFYDKKNLNNECAKYKVMLEEIAQGFQAAKELSGISYVRWVEKGCYFERVVDRKAQKNLTKKYKRGMKLFGEHFLGLWD